MEPNWGLELWDRLDDIINHCNMSSSLIDKCYKCFNECHSIWIKSATKQKRLLEKLQQEFNEPYHKEFTFSMSLLSVISNFIAIYNVTNTFAQSSTKVSKDYLKKSHSHIKKQTQAWIAEKKKMEDELYKERKHYDAALKRYREKQQQLISANENYKRTDECRTMSRSQVDLTLNTMYFRRSDYDQAKQEYAVKLRDFNALQQSHFSTKIPKWTKKGEQLYKDRLELMGKFGMDMSLLTDDMIGKMSHSIKQFGDVKESMIFSKDQKALIQRFKTGDVPPSELKFIDLDMSMPEQFKVINSSTSSQNESSSGGVTAGGPIVKMQRASMSSFVLSAQMDSDNEKYQEGDDDDSDEFTDEDDVDDFTTSSGSNSLNQEKAPVKPNETESFKVRGYSSSHINTKVPADQSNYVVRNPSNNSNNSANNPRIRPMLMNRRQDATDTSNSSFNLSSNHQDTRSDIGMSGSVHSGSRWTVNSVKMKGVGNRIFNPESRFSIQKSGKIFRSSQPWKASTPGDSNYPQTGGSVAAQTKMYQKRSTSRRESSHNQSHRRSRSVTDLISTFVRSSLRIKNSDNVQDSNEDSHRFSHGSSIKRNSSVKNNDDSDNDGDYEYCRPEIVNTPAEAVAMSRNVRKLSAPEIEHALQYYHQNSSPVSPGRDVATNLTVRPPSPDYDNMSSIATNDHHYRHKHKHRQQECQETDLDDPVVYVGSCVAEFDFDGNNFSDGGYLSILAGDQFYIIEMDSPNEGWIFVEKTDRSARGHVPTSYVQLRLFNESDFSNSTNLTNKYDANVSSEAIV